MYVPVCMCVFVCYACTCYKCVCPVHSKVQGGCPQPALSFPNICPGERISYRTQSLVLQTSEPPLQFDKHSLMTEKNWLPMWLRYEDENWLCRKTRGRTQGRLLTAGSSTSSVLAKDGGAEQKTCLDQWENSQPSERVLDPAVQGASPQAKASAALLGSLDGLAHCLNWLQDLSLN